MSDSRAQIQREMIAEEGGKHDKRKGVAMRTAKIKK